jgi:membrane protease YdiL (CAAX protease family)
VGDPKPTLLSFAGLVNGTLLVGLGAWSYRRPAEALLVISAQVCTNVLLNLTQLLVSDRGQNPAFALGYVAGAVLVAALAVVALVRVARAEGKGGITGFVLGTSILLTFVQLAFSVVWIFGIKGDAAIPVYAASLMTVLGAVMARFVNPGVTVGWALPRSWASFVWPLAGAVVLGWVAGRYMEFVVYAFGPAVLELEKALESLPRGPKIAFIVLIAPIAEEVLFRGYFQEVLKQAWGAPSAILATALLFAVAHMMPVAFPVLLVAGLTLGLAKHYSGSLLPGIAFHIIYNALATV